jgi:4-hydroxy-tetrahydrodipicolinate reductase
MNIMIVGRHGRMNQLIAQQSAERGFSLCVLGSDDHQNEIDVLIDFSGAGAWYAIDRFFENHCAAFVSGTTGLQQEHWQLFKKWSLQQPVYHTPNFSPGINALREMIKAINRDGWQIDIKESHHTHKKDCPSGTSLLLAQDLGLTQDSITSERYGDNPGEHVITMRRPDELLCLSHRVFNRSLFAKAALDVACWLKNLPPGDYSQR